MNLIKKQFLFGLLLIFISFINVTAQTVKKDSTEQTFNIRRTELHKIQAKANGVLYPIYVSLPGEYNYTTKNYPVVVMLDAYSSFGTMVQTTRLLTFNKDLPEIIIVGISSEGGSREFNINRMRDYTPTPALTEIEKDRFPISGGGVKFLNFIKEELLPFISSTYRIDNNDKTFVGHSLGGLIVFFTLFSEPALFNKYVMISPALKWNDELILKMENKYFETNKELDAKVYTTVGSLEESMFIEPWRNLTASIKNHNYKKLRFFSEISPNETHYTIIPFIATHGLLSVFNR